MEVSKNDVYRLFLQAVLSRGILSETVAKLLMEQCYKAVVASNDQLHLGNPNWHDFIRNINASIDKLDFEFRLIQDENTGKVFYALVNRKGDEIAQVATDYNPAEIAFFKGVVEQIMLAPNESYSVTSLAALREISILKLNLSKAQGESLLSSFVARGWLNRSKRGRYSLAMRSLLELLPYLKTTYPDEILECTICEDILTRGAACPRQNCKTRIHYHCFSRYRTSKQGTLTCPACSIQWPDDAKAEPLRPVGEDAARGDDGGNRRRTRHQTRETDEEEEAQLSGSESHEAEPAQTQVKKEKTTRTTRRSSGRTGDVEMEDAGPSQAPRRSTRRG
ncbi:hypothetical protein CC1G_11940 [Coprinopsis cinerea okayama7|uniref:Non-structural maintenance of chromosomes element 1 homolog n=1 Tax=Coprinopsis cinerea (strain Okayama-7 / 130 / ATCC MYA-4618 / FGSC 9003) TaxID=240176 RepID=A8NFT1_COPC7|nr:hypothetical protein CC1G_11940 [Coprinopsis cinerea okayama7\|eukprot:XP_001833363.2 hypothetical protein CC1G_11940 [Coprinopsis cinerea okayama7\